MKRDVEVGGIGLHVDTSSDSIDFLNISSQVEFTLLKFNVEVDMENTIFKLGMCFSNTKEFREAVRNYVMKNGRRVRFAQNGPNKLRTVYYDGCDWLIYASKVQREHILQVKTLNPVHICYRALHVPQISSKWLANKYCDRLVNNPTQPYASLKQTMESESILKLSKIVVYRVMAIIMSMIIGNGEEQHWMLRSYYQTFLDSNPRSTYEIKSEQY